MLELAAAFSMFMQGDFSGFTLMAERMLVRLESVRFPDGFLICIPQLILPLSYV